MINATMQTQIQLCLQCNHVNIDQTQTYRHDFVALNDCSLDRYLYSSLFVVFTTQMKRQIGTSISNGLGNNHLDK